MADSTPIAAEVRRRGPVAQETERAVARETVPWYIWSAVISVISVMMGGYWDISWHMSIGRDTFWTPAHIAIYFSGVLAGISCGYLILSTTFGGRAAARDASVKIWGMYGPLGAFVAAWGGMAMLTSAPFDNWWHNAYGLDVKIFSPPHMALDTGILAVQVGGLVLMGAAMNRAQGRLRLKLQWLFLFMGAMIVTLGLTAVWEYTYRIFMHSVRCYRAVSIVAPALLIGAARASRSRWAATILAGIYSAYLMAMLWIFPLFPAQPKLGPVYQRITHFIPLEFPLLLIVPALALDILWEQTGHSRNWNPWLHSLVAGCLFLVTFVAVQWPFASFLLSPASRNWFFGTHYFSYFTAPHFYNVRGLFILDHTPAEFRLGMAEALGFAILSTRFGLAWGEWMRQVRR